MSQRNYPRWQYAIVEGKVAQRQIKSADQEDPETWKESPADLDRSNSTAAPHGGMACAEIDAKYHESYSRRLEENNGLREQLRQATEANLELSDKNADLQRSLDSALSLLNQVPEPAPLQPPQPEQSAQPEVEAQPDPNLPEVEPEQAADAKPEARRKGKK